MLNVREVDVITDDGEYILKDINFSLDNGQIIGLLGQSGSGKSTLLQVLSSRLAVVDNLETGGTVQLNDRDVKSLGSTCLLLPSCSEFLHNLNVKQIIALECAIRTGHFRGSHDIHMIAAVADLDAFTDRYVESLGRSRLNMYQRKLLAIAISFVSSEPVVMFDEPTSFLTPEESARILYLFKKSVTYKAHRVGLVTIHQPTIEELQVFDKVLVLTNEGRVAHFSSVKDFLTTGCKEREESLRLLSEASQIQLDYHYTNPDTPPMSLQPVPVDDRHMSVNEDEQMDSEAAIHMEDGSVAAARETLRLKKHRTFKQRVTIVLALLGRSTLVRLQGPMEIGCVLFAILCISFLFGFVFIGSARYVRSTSGQTDTGELKIYLDLWKGSIINGFGPYHRHILDEWPIEVAASAMDTDVNQYLSIYNPVDGSMATSTSKNWKSSGGRRLDQWYKDDNEDRDGVGGEDQSGRLDVVGASGGAMLGDILDIISKQKGEIYDIGRGEDSSVKEFLRYIGLGDEDDIKPDLPANDEYDDEPPADWETTEPPWERDIEWFIDNSMDLIYCVNHYWRLKERFPYYPEPVEVIDRAFSTNNDATGYVIPATKPSSLFDGYGDKLALTLTQVFQALDYLLTDSITVNRLLTCGKSSWITYYTCVLTADREADGVLTCGLRKPLSVDHMHDSPYDQVATTTNTPSDNLHVYADSEPNRENALQKILEAVSLGCGFVFLLATTIFCQFPIVILLSAERRLVNRESIAKMYNYVYYFFARIIADVPFDTLPVILLSVLFSFMIDLPRSIYGVLVTTFVSLAWAHGGVAYLSSTICRKQYQAIGLFIGYSFLGIIFSGFLLRSRDMPIWCGWFKYCSTLYWAYGSIIYTLFPKGTTYRNIPNLMIRYALGATDEAPSYMWYTVCVLLTMGVIFRAISFLCMRFLYRDVGVFQYVE